MKGTSLGVLACPHCHQDLDYSGLEEASIQVGFLTCPRCALAFKRAGGIPRFIEPEHLTGLNKRFARIYERVSWSYRLFPRRLGLDGQLWSRLLER